MFKALQHAYSVLIHVWDHSGGPNNRNYCESSIVIWYNIGIMANQMEKNMEHEMENAIYVPNGFTSKWASPRVATSRLRPRKKLGVAAFPGAGSLPQWSICFVVCVVGLLQQVQLASVVNLCSVVDSN